jgi:hypothetical protein
MSSIQYSQPAPQVQEARGAVGDPIAQLPVDQSQPTNNELQIVNSLFTKHKGTVNTLVAEAKDSLIIGLLFIIFSLPVVDSLIKRLIPMTQKSSHVLVAVKAVAVMAIFWLVSHFYLSRKSS